ncbi:hypothetical protein SDC9_05989 [bioreactor metagenome]|uniref:Prepilin-type N-terminal cleavage/methylation domain-containing protein n=1 Tax=bioreactor metagenome TaxID=1076179 RepID=A0A644T0G3_9ZZZZ|nr:prepilin-type N-terminal cleavage/methylation domain-containing protein [Negativicutes bacterium]
MQRGFTVIEIIIVIAILGVFAGLALPAVNNMIAKQNLDTSAQILASDLRWVQQLCINTTPDTLFPQIKPLSNKYIVKKGSNVIKTVNLPDGITISGPQTLTFSINGTPLTDNQPLPATLLLTSKNTTNIRHVIISTVGRIRVE